MYDKNRQNNINNKNKYINEIRNKKKRAMVKSLKVGEIISFLSSNKIFVSSNCLKKRKKIKNKIKLNVKS